MALGINTNLNSLTAQNSATKSQNSLSTAIARLSSGLRINSAADDAAGLAISQRMTAQVNGLNQAARNANDGISLAQTADGALSSVSDNLQRMRELAVQSANATNSASDRQALQQEVTQLAQEIDRVATQTQFNGTNLLDGSFTSKQFQVGANAGQTISVSGISSARTGSLGASYSAKVDGGTITGAIASGDLTINGKTIEASAVGTGNATGQAATSAYSIAKAINDSQTDVVATANATKTAAGSVPAAAADIAAGSFSINGVAIGAVSAGADPIGQGNAVAAAINKASAATGVTAKADDTGAITLTAADGSDISITGTIDNTGLTAGTTHGTVSLSSTSTDGIDIGGTTAGLAAAGLTSGKKDASLGGTAISQIDISTVQGANDALASIDAALNTINSSRAQLGAIQNRFSSTVSNLQTTAENTTASKSRITDADFAAETANLSRAQVLQQAGTAMIAQANQLPQQVLKLLQ